MEHINLKQLQDFKAGRLTRRELIKELGITIATASITRSTRTWATQAKGLKATAVNHISYQVEDYAKSHDFYVNLLGMKPYLDTGKQCNLTVGDNTYIVIHNRRSTVSQIDHVAYTIENWDKGAVEAELKSRGLDPRGLGDNPDSFMVRDPDGLGVQISGKGLLDSAPVISIAEKKLKAVAVNHVSYQVENYVKSRDFYANLLDMKPYLDTGKQCNLMVGNSIYIVVHNRSSALSQIDHVAYTIENWNRGAVEAELKSRGLDPRRLGDNPDSFMVRDPDRIGVQISGKSITPQNPPAPCK
jgi:catechol 2,3-dioxygenase-like lactoylglutathione lyase family enzyme